MASIEVNAGKKSSTSFVFCFLQLTMQKIWQCTQKYYQTQRIKQNI